MIGNKYFHTGITFTFGYAGNNQHGWRATAGFFDVGFANDDTDAYQVSTEGKLSTRYAVKDGVNVSGIQAAAQIMLEDLERFGIESMSGDNKAFFIDVDNSTYVTDEDIDTLRAFGKEKGYIVILECK
jgi:hypothetical protein